MSKKQDDFAIEGTIRMNEEETDCILEISSADGKPLTAQVILDHVADMLMTYYDISKEDWAKVGLEEDEDTDGKILQ